VGSIPSLVGPRSVIAWAWTGARPREVFKNLLDSKRKMNRRNRIIPFVFSEKE